MRKVLVETEERVSWKSELRRHFGFWKIKCEVVGRGEVGGELGEGRYRRVILG